MHNTYGDRHAYLVHPDDQGRATTPKAMYVSPFHGTDGSYELAVPVPHDDRLDIAITLRTDDGARFSASLSGRRRRPHPETDRASRHPGYRPDPNAWHLAVAASTADPAPPHPHAEGSPA